MSDYSIVLSSEQNKAMQQAVLRKEQDIQKRKSEDWRYILPFFLIVSVVLLTLFRFLGSGAAPTPLVLKEDNLVREPGQSADDDAAQLLAGRAKEREPVLDVVRVVGAVELEVAEARLVGEQRLRARQGQREVEMENSKLTWRSCASLSRPAGRTSIKLSRFICLSTARSTTSLLCAKRRATMMPTMLPNPKIQKLRFLLGFARFVFCMCSLIWFSFSIGTLTLPLPASVEVESVGAGLLILVVLAVAT